MIRAADDGAREKRFTQKARVRKSGAHRRAEKPERRYGAVAAAAPADIPPTIAFISDVTGCNT